MSATTSVRGTTTVELPPLRYAAVAMIGVAAAKATVLPTGLGPPCPLRTLTGIPCPLCGSTRAAVAAVQGDLAHALFMNPAGLAAIVLAVVVLVAWRWQRWTIPAWVIPVSLAVLWCWQLFKYTTGRPI